MLRRDSSARFDVKGHLFKKYTFTVGQGWSRVWRKKPFNEALYRQLLAAQKEEPVPLLHQPPRTWWMFKDRIYWEDEELTDYQVKALILERLRREEKKVERAITLMERGDPGQALHREPIPDEVKVFVWRRDQGRCVKCSSQANLEFDHIIPLAMGGSNTSRNIQLLCESCNRSKRDSLI